MKTKLLVMGSLLLLIINIPAYAKERKVRTLGDKPTHSESMIMTELDYLEKAAPEIKWVVISNAYIYVGVNKKKIQDDFRLVASGIAENAASAGGANKIAFFYDAKTFPLYSPQLLGKDFCSASATYRPDFPGTQKSQASGNSCR